MTIFRYFSRLFIKYFLIMIILILAGFILFMGVSFSQINRQNQVCSSPHMVRTELVNDKEKQVILDAKDKQLLNQEKIWLMELNPQGEIVQSYRLPSNLDKDYSMQDVVRFTRWYLEDYPVFNFLVGDNILILGYPKGVYDKFPDNYYRFENLKYMFFAAVGIFLLMLFVLFIIFFRSRYLLEKELKPISQAIEHLKNNQPVQFATTGNFSEIKETLNQASDFMQENQKNRDHWIRGVSHDLRNPLTLIMGQTHQLEQTMGAHRELEQIRGQVGQMQDIISSLNLIYLLDNPQAVGNFETIKFDVFMRECLSGFLNQYPEVEMDLDLSQTGALVMGISTLLQRSIYNLLHNAINHNPRVKIQVGLYKEDNRVRLVIADDGIICEDKVLELQMKSRNYSTHGMGTLISKQIVMLHEGSIDFEYNHPGLKVTIQLPVINEKADAH